MEKAIGQGVFAIANSSKIPQPLAEDYQRNAAADYEYGTPGTLIQAWIRRAVHAELFAKTLEQDLEKLKARLEY